MNENNSVRVRFAPSPTGSLHIGGVRTALFNYLFARSLNGVFLLRIEDTDRERSRPQFETEIIESLQWLGLNRDEEIVRQSDRLRRYREAADELIRQGQAYEEVSGEKKAVKFKMPKKKVKFDDLVHGPVEFDSTLFDDLVIQKSDGFPTYHFACVIDDHDMRISHVIRGDDHLSNTPRQVLLCEAFGWTPPQFGHLPLVFGADKTPLSKRNGNASFHAYRDAGYLPDAILNYLALLGWAPGGNQEFFKLAELTGQFNMARVNRTNACFDAEKMKWLNAEHIKSLDPEIFAARAEEYLRYRVLIESACPSERVRAVALLYQERVRIFSELWEQARFFFEDDLAFDPVAVGKHLKGDDSRKMLSAWKEVLEREGDFEDVSALERLLRGTAEKLNIKAGALIHSTRVAISGKSVTPGLFEVMSVLGRDRTLKRLQFAVDHFEKLVAGQT